MGLGAEVCGDAILSADADGVRRRVDAGFIAERPRDADDRQEETGAVRFGGARRPDQDALADNDLDVCRRFRLILICRLAGAWFAVRRADLRYCCPYGRALSQRADRQAGQHERHNR